VHEIKINEKEDKFDITYPEHESAEEIKIFNTKSIAEKQDTVVYESVTNTSVESSFGSSVMGMRQVEANKGPLIVEDTTKDYSAEIVTSKLGNKMIKMVARVEREPPLESSNKISGIQTNEKEETLELKHPKLERAKENKNVQSKSVADKQDTIVYDSVSNEKLECQAGSSAKAVRQMEANKEPLIIENTTKDWSTENTEQKGFKSQHATASKSLKQVVSIETNASSQQSGIKTFEPSKTEDVTVSKIAKEALDMSSTSTSQHPQTLYKVKYEGITIAPSNIEEEIMYPNSEETIAISTNIFSNNKKKIQPECIPQQDFAYSTEESISLSHEQLKADIKKATQLISQNFQVGMSISEVPKLLNTEQVELMKQPEAQVALLNIAERLGNAPIIHKTIVSQISKNCETTETFGMKALFVALEETQSSAQSVVSCFEPEDFDKSKARATLCQILNEAYEVGTNLPQVCCSSGL